MRIDKKKRSEEKIIQTKPNCQQSSLSTFKVDNENNKKQQSSDSSAQLQLQQASQQGFDFAQIPLHPPSMTTSGIQKKASQQNLKIELESPQQQQIFRQTIDSANLANIGGNNGKNGKLTVAQRMIENRRQEISLQRKRDSLPPSMMTQRIMHREDDSQTRQMPNQSNFAHHIPILQRSDIDVSQLAVKPNHLQRDTQTSEANYLDNTDNFSTVEQTTISNPISDSSPTSKKDKTSIKQKFKSLLKRHKDKTQNTTQELDLDIDYSELREIGEMYQNEQGNQPADLRQKIIEKIEKLKQLNDSCVQKQQEINSLKKSSLSYPKQHRKLKQELNELKTQRKILHEFLRVQNIDVTLKGEFDITSLNERSVEYDLTPPQQQNTQVIVSGGKLKRSNGKQKPVDTKESSTFFNGKGWEIFVMSPTGQIHMTSHQVGKRHHSSLLAGAAVAGAGEMRVSKGKIMILTNKSGHYRPDETQMFYVLHRLQKMGINLNFKIKIHTPMGVEDLSAQEFFARKKGEMLSNTTTSTTQTTSVPETDHNDQEVNYT